MSVLIVQIHTINFKKKEGGEKKKGEKREKEKREGIDILYILF